MRIRRSSIWMFLGIFSLLISGCTGGQTATAPSAPSLTPSPTAVATATVTPLPPTATAAATPTPAAPLPAVSFREGERYFRIGDKPGFIFSRNIAAYTMDDFDPLMAMVRGGGSRVVRLQVSTVVAGGMGYTRRGQIDDAWARRWEKVFETAEANGIYIIVVFTGWYDWNTTGFNAWAQNPFNAANGGPAERPTELFENGSPVQVLWMQWLEQIVARWQKHKSILAWETYSEANLTQGVSEPAGIDFIEQAAAIIRQTDPAHRPITASLADVGNWPDFYRSTAIDFINIHPYPPSGQLDNTILAEVRQVLEQYRKPVMIGESGLSAETPDRNPPTLTTAERADFGVRHAIWAAIVSGAMNGRALYWEDGYGIYFPDLSWSFLKKYGEAEGAAANFVRDVDFTGFRPLDVTTGASVTGAAVGNETSAIGWFRDATCEPPDWPLQPVISNARITLQMPGDAGHWQVDFYDPQDGTQIVGSAAVESRGGRLTLTLPDFNDAIAFKLHALSGAGVPGPSTPEPAVNRTQSIAGKWGGTIHGKTGDFSAEVELTILDDCDLGSNCGTVAVPQLPCSGSLVLNAIDGDTFVFIEQDMKGAAACVSGGYEYLRLRSSDVLEFNYTYTSGGGEKITSSGVLERR